MMIMMMVMQMILPHLEVYNEDDDLGNRGLQTEQVGVLIFQSLIIGCSYLYYGKF